MQIVITQGHRIPNRKKIRSFNVSPNKKVYFFSMLLALARERSSKLPFKTQNFTIAICCLIRSLAAFSSAFSLFLSSNIRFVNSSSCRLLYSSISLPVFLRSISFLISFCIKNRDNKNRTTKLPWTRLKHIFFLTGIKHLFKYRYLNKYCKQFYIFVLPVLLLSFSLLAFLQAFLLS